MSFFDSAKNENLEPTLIDIVCLTASINCCQNFSGLYLKYTEHFLAYIGARVTLKAGSYSSRYRSQPRLYLIL